ncbi:DUF4126 family protein [Candidatus Fermentibacteria bacterium]|nr:DUF4126 family protein [Candidatus Fermentibacteria bacterium]
MEVALSVSLGLGLSATCGFRVFVPLLCASVAAHLGWIDLGSGFEWMGTWPAMLAFGVAMLFELAGYLVPWVDNVLDSIATPMAVVAGIVLMASVVGGLPPLLRWSVAVIAGGGAAGTVQTGTVLVRGASSATTGGAGNPAVSTAEASASVLGSVLSILLPFAAAFLVLLLLLFILYRWGRGNDKTNINRHRYGKSRSNSNLISN